MSYITYPTPTPEEFRSFSSESEKYRHLTAPYCTGCGIDIASQGAVVVPWALSFDLPEKEFLRYSNGQPPKGPIHIRGHADRHIPIDSNSLDFVYASHILEDFERPKAWLRILTEWARVLKPGGYMIILVPEVKLWNAAIAAGQAPNCAHWAPEPILGDLTAHCTQVGLSLVKEELTNVVPGDYTILGVFQKP